MNLTVLNTNARSLCPKISSFIDCFSDMNAALGIITETWLADGADLQDDIDGLALGTGLKLICKNREVNEISGLAHGGIAIVFRESMLSLREVRLHNPGRLEVMMAAGTIKGSTRKIAVIACYLSLIHI